MYSDENKSSTLAKFLNPFDYVIIDTCSLMEEAFAEWMDILRNAKEYRKKDQIIYVPRRCYDELKKHARQEKDDSKRIDAKRGLKILRHDKWWTHLLTITKKDKTENFADNAIYVKVCADRLFSKILIITQDKFLASDLRALNLLKSQSGRPLEVCKIVAGGKLVQNLGEKRPSKEQKGHAAPTQDRAKAQQQKAPSSQDDILAADRRLSAVLGNANYPDAKKKADVQTQISALEKIPTATRSKLPLTLSLPKLRLYLSTGTLKEEKPAKPQEKLSKQNENPAKAERNVEKQQKLPAPVKPQEMKKEAPAVKLEATLSEKAKKPSVDAARPYYGAGKTLLEAIDDWANHYAVIFREPTVLYYPQVHGPVDLTSKDRIAIEAEGMAALKGNEKSAFSHNGIPMWSQKASDVRYKLWVEIPVAPAKPAEKAPEQPAKDIESPTKAETPKKAKTKAAPKKQEQPKPEPKPEEQKAVVDASAAAKPMEETPKAEPAKKATPKKKTVSKAKQPEEAASSKADEPVTKAEPKKAKKPAKDQPLEEKAAEPKPAKKTQKTLAKKADVEKNAAEPAPKEKKTAPKKKAASPEFKKAQAADKRLQSVLPNPTYAMEDKIKDLAEQKELLFSLTEAEISKLKYGPKEIEEWLKSNQGVTVPEGGQIS